MALGKPTCCMPGCWAAAFSHSLCSKHHQRRPSVLARKRAWAKSTMTEARRVAKVGRTRVWRDSQQGTPAHVARIAESAQKTAAWRRANPDKRRAAALADHHRRQAGRNPEAEPLLAAVRNDPCSYCGGPADTLDHIIPLAAGGPNGWENLTAACRSCNSRKRSTPLLHALLRMAA